MAGEADVRAAGPSLQMRGITKRFPGVVANDGIDLSLYSGEIHALLGENGAGKSTLMNILTGIYAANSGAIYIHGREVEMRFPADARRLGIGMVHQHFRLIESLTAAENVLLCSGALPFRLRRSVMNALVADCSERFGLAVDPAAKIWQLSVGEQQRVAILKQLYAGVEFLILDEPTAVLTPQESAALFKTLRVMARAGKTILFITHKLFEVMTYSDRITVLRGGRSVAARETGAVDKAALTRLMVGREVEESEAERPSLEGRAVALRLQGVTALGERGLPALRDVSLEVRSGEILGIAGVAGNGQRELAEVIAGLRRPVSGKITLYKDDLTGLSPREALRAGVGFIPEDRMDTGLVGSLSLLDNAMLRSYDDAELSRGGFLDRRAIRLRAGEFVRQYEIKNAGFEKPVSLMSGGNLQKLLVAREVFAFPRVLVAAYPSHGVDIGATAAIHRLLLSQRDRGTAIVLISEDLEELFALSNRVAALSAGRVTGVIPTDHVSAAAYDEIGRLMLGGRHDGEDAESAYASGLEGEAA